MRRRAALRSVGGRRRQLVPRSARRSVSRLRGRIIRTKRSMPSGAPTVALCKVPQAPRWLLTCRALALAPSGIMGLQRARCRCARRRRRASLNHCTSHVTERISLRSLLVSARMPTFTSTSRATGASFSLFTQPLAAAVGVPRP